MNITSRLLIGAAAVSLSLPAAALSIECAPGKLASLLGDEAASAESLTITGSIDQRDFETIADMPMLKELNLSDASIAYYRPRAIKGSMQAEFKADMIPGGALLAKGLTSLTLPASLKVIGQGALAGNLFESITIPEGVTTIESDAFYGCSNLKSISLPESVISLGENIFTDCSSLQSATILSPITSLPLGTFLRCTALESVELPASLQSIGSQAFAGCTALTAIEFPASLKSIDSLAFAAAGLTELTIPAGVSSIGDEAFALCPELVEASLAAVPTLGEGVFFACPKFVALEFVSDSPIAYPDYLFAGNDSMIHSSIEGISELGRYALKDNQAAGKLTISADLQRLGDGALENMAGLQMIDVQALDDNVPELGKDVFAGINQEEVVLQTAEFVPTTNWEAAAQWNEFKITPFSAVTTPGASASDVRAWFAGKSLRVTANNEISSVSVVDAAGRQLVRLNPYAESATINMADFSEKVYIVNVTTSATTVTFKLTR